MLVLVAAKGLLSANGCLEEQSREGRCGEDWVNCVRMLFMLGLPENEPQFSWGASHCESANKDLPLRLANYFLLKCYEIVKETFKFFLKSTSTCLTPKTVTV